MANYTDSGTPTGVARVNAAFELYFPAVVAIPQLQTLSWKEVGDASTPQEIRRARRQVMDMLRKSGEPVVLKHQWGQVDVDAGVAKKCPGCFDDDFDQVRNNCQVCFGVGFVSVAFEPSGTLFVNNRGQVVSGDPGTGIRAPQYGGYGQSYLTWMIEPDVTTDIFKPNEQGIMVQVEEARGFAAWFPLLHDNDLCINVTIAPDGFRIEQTNERYHLKQVQPNTIRGWGARTVGKIHNVWQSFEMARIPDNVIQQNVPI